jgi:membrane-associated phospholipid phosphatase
MKPFVRPFDPNDEELSHPHLENIIPNWLLVVLAIILPNAIGFLYYCFVFASRRASLHDTLYSLHLFMISCLMSIALAQFFTNFVKNWAGRLRPDFLDRCQYNNSTNVCDGGINLIEDGRKSFWSGHASMSFAGLGFLSIWIGGLVLNGVWIHHLPSIQPYYLRDSSIRLWRFFLPTLPLLLASYIAISRTQQYIHFPTDVIAGSLFGSLTAILVYFLYYRTHCIKEFEYTLLDHQ